MTRIRASHIGVVAILLGGFLSGCGAGDNGWPKRYPVSGKVLVDGQPAVRATITFHPAEAQAGGKIYKPTAFTDDDGAFSLTTLEAEDGAPLGEYTVTVVATYKVVNKQDMMVPDLLHGKYADVKSSPLKITVREQVNVLEPFDLKSR